MTSYFEILLLVHIVRAIIGFGPTSAVAPGEELTWTSWIGVAPELAASDGGTWAVAGAGPVSQSHNVSPARSRAAATKSPT